MEQTAKSGLSPGSPASEELNETYLRRFQGQEARRKEVWETLVRYFFRRWLDPSNVVLDLGAGYCEFINSIRAKQKFALDLNPATVDRAAADVRVLPQDVTETWNVHSQSVDVLFTSNFFEHLASKDQLIHCLRETNRILKPGGRFIALGPNIRFAYREYWDFFDHYLPLSDRSLAEALRINGFEIEQIISRFLPYTMKGAPSHPLLVRLYLALPVLWRIFGKQFLVVACKPRIGGTNTAP